MASPGQLGGSGSVSSPAAPSCGGPASPATPLPEPGNVAHSRHVPPVRTPARDVRWPFLLGSLGFGQTASPAPGIDHLPQYTVRRDVLGQIRCLKSSVLDCQAFAEASARGTRNASDVFCGAPPTPSELAPGTPVVVRGVGGPGAPPVYGTVSATPPTTRRAVHVDVLGIRGVSPIGRARTCVVRWWRVRVCVRGHGTNVTCMRTWGCT